MQTGYGVHERGLTRAVGPDARHDLAGLDVQRDVPERPHIAVVGRQALDLEHQRSSAPGLGAASGISASPRLWLDSRAPAWPGPLATPELACHPATGPSR